MNPDTPSIPALELQQIDPARRRARRYHMSLCRSLFGEHGLLITWGRVGKQPRVRLETFGTAAELDARWRQLLARRTSHGYRSPPDKLPNCCGATFSERIANAIRTIPPHREAYETEECPRVGRRISADGARRPGGRTDRVGVVAPAGARRPRQDLFARAVEPSNSAATEIAEMSSTLSRFAAAHRGGKRTADGERAAAPSEPTR
jgi:predicted DNA-binding WGR domain protein